MKEAKKMKLKREIRITPAFDKRSDEPSKDYGIGSCRIWFIVSGKAGAVVVNFFTNWFLSKTVKEYKEEGIFRNTLDLNSRGRENFKTKINLENKTPLRACSWDYHSKKKRKYAIKNKDCEFVGGVCYCDGSCLRADKYKDLLLSEGSEGVFKQLEEDYKIEFKEE